MGLDTYSKATTFVPFSAKEGSDGITLRALDLDDIGGLVSDHLGAIANALELYEELKANIKETNSLDRFMISLIRILPDLAGELIAVSAGVPELADKAKALAFGIQLRAISAITHMTLEDAGGIKNLYAGLSSVLAGIQMPQMIARATAAREPAAKLQS